MDPTHATKTARAAPDTAPSLGRALREVASLRPLWALAFYAVVALRPLYTWFSLIRSHPGAPLAVQVMYRPGGDIQYFPLVTALSRLTLGDGVLLERFRHGFGAFPIVGLLPHALFFGAFGPSGYIVADLVVTLAYYVALAALLRLVGLSVFGARVAAMLIATGALERAWNGAVTWQLLPGAAQVNLWGDRLPRTFTTEVVLLLTLGALVAMARTPPEAQEPRQWVVLGVCYAALLQSDLYASMTLAMSVVALVLVIAWQLRRDPTRFARCAAACLVATLVVAVPFFVQQLGAHPDLARRLGVVPVPRPPLNGALFWQTLKGLEPDLPRIRLVVFPALLGLAVLPGMYADHRARRLGLVVVGVAGTTLAAFVTQPVSQFLMGKTVQPYHFGQFSWQLSSYALVILALLLGRACLELARRRRPARRWRWMMAPLVGSAALLAGVDARSAVLVRRSWEPAPYGDGAVRSDFGEYGALPNYRARFTELARELSSDRYRDARVLGTLDHQVYVYWTAFERRFVTVADPFASTAPDEENELRLMSLLKLLGAAPAELKRFIELPVNLVFFVGHSKYSNGYWSMTLPKPESARLVKAYEQLQPSQTPFAPPDVIVLSTNETGRGLHPPPAAYQRTYANDLFQVWKRL